MPRVSSWFFLFFLFFLISKKSVHVSSHNCTTCQY